MSLVVWIPWLLLKGFAWSLLALILYVVVNPFHRLRMKHIPGPAYRPIFGNLPEFRDIGSHEFMAQCRQKYGPIFKLWFGHRPWVIVCDPDVGKRVNYKLINRPSRLGDPLIRGDVVKPENRGLFLSRDDHWRHLHRVWQPVFYADSVRACAPLMESTTRRMLHRLDQLAASGQPLDIGREVGNLTMGIVGTAAYGIDFHTVDAPEASAGADKPAQPVAVTRMSASLASRLAGSFSAVVGTDTAISLEEVDTGRQLIEAAKVVFKSAAAISGSAYQRLALLAPAVLLGPINLLAHLLPDKPFQQVLEARLMLSSASIALVRQARAALQQKKAQEQAAAAAAGADAVAVVTGAAAGSAGAGKVVSRPRGSIAPGSFLGLLLSARDKAGEGLTDLQMVMQANVFTLAGYETTANTLAFSLFLLATHPEVEAKVVEEIRAAAEQEAAEEAAAATEGRKHQPWYNRSLEEQFPYICAVVSEALRLYPPGANTLRENGDEAFQVGRYILPPRSTIVVATYVMQRDPEMWPEASAFKPERWLPGNEHLAPKNPAAYLPFGSGGRQCIGQRFALQEVRLGLVQLLQRFHYDIDWTLMAPSPANSAPTTSERGCEGDCSSKRALKTVNNFTLCPAGGIWVRLQPRVCPPGMKLL